jgi:hypothetical protein
MNPILQNVEPAASQTASAPRNRPIRTSVRPTNSRASDFVAETTRFVQGKRDHFTFSPAITQLEVAIVFPDFRRKSTERKQTREHCLPRPRRGCRQITGPADAIAVRTPPRASLGQPA